MSKTKAKPTFAEQARFSHTAITAAVEPMRADAMESARKRAEEHVERMLAEYAADCTAFDYPMLSRMSNVEWKMQRNRYQAFNEITRMVKGPKGFGYAKRADGKEGLQERDDAKIADFIQRAVDRAAEQYTAFINKLNEKVGEHTAATIEGSHVWGDSLLTVTMPDGSIQLWRTKQIWNTSPLGLVFPQWPSRKVKR